jgi:hypothetical protein
MDYHACNRSGDGVLQMPSDGSAFREIKEKWADFKDEPRNVRLSLAVDGVNPFGDIRSIYSVWPIFVINNKILPWMSIKREHIMLTMIVLGICLHKFFEFNIFICLNFCIISFVYLFSYIYYMISFL